ncbi:MAG: BrnT family toxin [Myxococcales bacterium]|nr:BrnT family toxin [Myxococcales bacterium]
MQFEWDSAKDARNQTKHGLSFAEAIGIFEAADEALELYDAQHSDIEDRFITIGPIRAGLVLVVWTERADDVIRVISARWATPRERRLYQAHMERRR